MPCSVAGVSKLIGSLAVALAAVLVVTGVFAVKLYGSYTDDSRRDDILSAARGFATGFTTLDYRTYDKDTRNLLGRTSKAFRDRLADVLQQAQAGVTAGKAAQRGKVVAAGLVSEGADAARVLVVVDAQVTNAAAQQPAPRHYRLQLDLVHEDDRWLTSDLVTVP